MELLDFLVHLLSLFFRRLLRCPISLGSPSPSFICFYRFWCEIQSGCKCIFFIWRSLCQASFPVLVCRVRWRRMVMTLALWDWEWMEFKSSLYIRAPVNHSRPSTRSTSRERERVCVCVYVGSFVWSGGATWRNGRIKTSQVGISTNPIPL